MEKEFKTWLKEHCCVWYLLSQEQEEVYFSEWFDECMKGKEQEDDEQMV